MVADTTKISGELRSAFADVLIAETEGLRRQMVLMFGGDPDAKYRELPLTPEHEAENAAWQKRADAARELIDGHIAQAVTAFEKQHGVKVWQEEDGWSIAYTPPHPRQYERIA